MSILKRFTGVWLAVLCASAAPAQMSSFSERNPRYFLQPLDVLEIHYRFSPEFDQTATVQPDGFLSLAVVGDIKVQGLTLDQAKAAILEKASERLRDPEISVILKEFEKPYFTVGGEVANPGRYEMRGPISPYQAIAMAGGFKTLSAKNGQVILLRRVGPDLAKTQILDLRDTEHARADEGVRDLLTGDMLIVPQNRISQIERYVKIINFGTYIPLK